MTRWHCVSYHTSVTELNSTLNLTFLSSSVTADFPLAELPPLEPGDLSSQQQKQQVPALHARRIEFRNWNGNKKVSSDWYFSNLSTSTPLQCNKWLSDPRFSEYYGPKIFSLTIYNEKHTLLCEQIEGKFEIKTGHAECRKDTHWDSGVSQVLNHSKIFVWSWNSFSKNLTI